MYYTRRVIRSSSDKIKYQELLKRSEIVYEELEFSFGIFNGECLIGAISLDGNCIKQICIDSEFQGEGVAGMLVSEVISYASSKEVVDLFVFTKPEYEKIFTHLGFHTIVKTDAVLFLENNKQGINHYVDELKSSLVEGKNIGAIVMNLNPITNGHLYLIEEAVKKCDHIHLFLVKEDKSSFPYEVRKKLLTQSVSHISNLTIHFGSEYIISSATFPTYFIKSGEELDRIYPLIDATIFVDYIAKALSINTRFVGTEPYSKTTNMYNEVLKSVLPKHNIEVVELERKIIDGEIVSASKVREMIRNDQLDKLENFVPSCVIKYLISDDAKSVVASIKENQTRH